MDWCIKPARMHIWLRLGIKTRPTAGEKFGADGDQTTATAMQAIKDAAGEEERQRQAEKAAKKAAFNSEYDVGKGLCTVLCRAVLYCVEEERHTKAALRCLQYIRWSDGQCSCGTLCCCIVLKLLKRLPLHVCWSQSPAMS